MNKYEELRDWQKKCGFKDPEDRINVYYSPEAFAKTIQLVRRHNNEIAWNMVMSPYKDGYKVYNIIVYPQKTSAGYVSVDTTKYGIWKAKLDDKIEAALNGQAHSHVKMSTFPSVVDVSQQHDEILMKNEGYYFFQIWNQYNEIHSFFYDIDNKVYYTDANIDIIVEDVDDFVCNSFKMIRNDCDFGEFGFEVGEEFESQ